MKTSNTIYSIPTRLEGGSAIHIETVITKGLYRFSILGIHQKEASDARDRVYSALRSSDVLNLKSDNRKITINITPSEKLGYSHVYDLGIALSCVHAMGHIEITEKILVIGELSIGGDIIQSKRILQTIFIALQEDIHTIICKEDDVNTLTPEIISVLSKNNIRILTGNTLHEVVYRISKKQYYIFDRLTAINHISHAPVSISHLLSNEVVLLTYIALCGGHDITFEVPNSVFIQDFISHIYKYEPSLNPYQLLYMAHISKENDDVVYDRYSHPYIAQIDYQTTRHDLQGYADTGILQKSILGHLLIKDLVSIPQHIWSTVLRSKRGHIVGLCKSCPCGVEPRFFSPTQQKCICIQRSILRYQQYLHGVYKDYFTLWLKTNVQVPKLTVSEVLSLHTEAEKVRKLQFERHFQGESSYEDSITVEYLNCNRDISLILKNLDIEAAIFYESIRDVYSQENVDKILRLSQTLQDIENMTGRIHAKSMVVTKQTMLLALSYIPRRDF